MHHLTKPIRHQSRLKLNFTISCVWENDTAVQPKGPSQKPGYFLRPISILSSWVHPALSVSLKHIRCLSRGSRPYVLSHLDRGHFLLNGVLSYTAIPSQTSVHAATRGSLLNHKPEEGSPLPSFTTALTRRGKLLNQRNRL